MDAIPSVAVYVTADAIYIISQQLTDHGRVSVEPMRRLDADATALAIGETVVAGLDSFREIDGQPDPDHLQGFLDFVGARSWGAFAKGALNVSVEGRSPATAALSAARADGRGAFAYGEGQECALDASSIGLAILQLIADNER